MIEKNTIQPLLNDIIKDNESYKFPIEFIQKELLSMFMNPEEFDYFTMQSYRSLKREYGFTIAHIFLTTLETKLKLKFRDIRILTEEQYREEVEAFISTLENLVITRIPKDSSDGEMMSAMI